MMFSENLYLPVLYTYHISIVAAILILAFAALYGVMATSFYFAIKFLLRKNKVQKIIVKPHFKDQIKFEIKQSLWSIFIFGLYGALIVFLFRQNAIRIDLSGGFMILVDLMILMIWNEIHFYIGHRIMHTNPLVKFHRVHHKSVVVTPFSTYSFHPIESVIMGSVMIIPLLIYPFQIWSLIIFPIYHLFFNTIGHTNVQFSSADKLKNSISRRHNLHHTKFSINYGFVSAVTDRIASFLKIK